MTTRLNIKLSEDAARSLDRLADVLGTTKTGALGYGLSLLSIAVRESKQGNALGVIHGERVVKELAGVWSGAEAVNA